MGDTSYLLKEIQESLPRIQETREALEDTREWEAQMEKIRDSKLQQLATDERTCKSYVTVARATVEMLHFLTGRFPEHFLCRERVERVAVMLNENLKQLCGPKCKNLTNEILDSFGWDPRLLLEQFADIYLNLRSEVFVQALAVDEKCSMDLFDDVADSLERATIKSPTQVTSNINLTTSKLLYYVLFT